MGESATMRPCRTEPLSNRFASRRWSPSGSRPAPSGRRPWPPRAGTSSTSPPTTFSSTCSPIRGRVPCRPSSGGRSWSATSPTPDPARSNGSRRWCETSPATASWSRPTRVGRRNGSSSRPRCRRARSCRTTVTSTRRGPTWRCRAPRRSTCPARRPRTW